MFTIGGHSNKATVALNYSINPMMLKMSQFKVSLNCSSLLCFNLDNSNIKLCQRAEREHRTVSIIHRGQHNQDLSDIRVCTKWFLIMWGEWNYSRQCYKLHYQLCREKICSPPTFVSVDICIQHNLDVRDSDEYLQKQVWGKRIFTTRNSRLFDLVEFMLNRKAFALSDMILFDPHI